jgi:hypothetical protein
MKKHIAPQPDKVAFVENRRSHFPQKLGIGEITHIFNSGNTIHPSEMVLYADM